MLAASVIHSRAGPRSRGLQNLRRLLHLERVADCHAERHVHVESTARTLRPHALPMATIFSASFRASSSVFIKAPEPTFTSRTMECEPAASFLDMMDDVMSGRESTVAVTSRSA